MLKNTKTQIHARGRHFSSLVMNCATKTFHALKRRFLLKFDYFRGFARGRHEWVLHLNTRMSAQLGGVCAYFDTKHKGSRCLTWKFTPVRCLFNVEMKYNCNSNTLKSASMPKQEFWYYTPFLRSYLHTKQKNLCDVSMWVLHPLPPPSAPSPISYIIYHFKVRNNHVCEIRRFKGVKCLWWVTTPKTD